MPSPKVPRVTKPCDRRGCPQIIHGRAKEVARRHYCSKRCLMLARIKAGYQPWAAMLRPEVRERCFAKVAESNKVMAERRRKRRALAIIRTLGDLISPELKDECSPASLALVKTLLARAYDKGHQVGYSQGWHAQHPVRARGKRLKAQQAKAAA